MRRVVEEFDTVFVATFCGKAQNSVAIAIEEMFEAPENTLCVQKLLFVTGVNERVPVTFEYCTEEETR